MQNLRPAPFFHTAERASLEPREFYRIHGRGDKFGDVRYRNRSSEAGLRLVNNLNVFLKMFLISNYKGGVVFKLIVENGGAAKFWVTHLRGA